MESTAGTYKKSQRPNCSAGQQSSPKVTLFTAVDELPSEPNQQS